MKVKSLIKISALLFAGLVSASVNAATISLVALYDGNDGTYNDGSDELSDIISQDLNEVTRLDWVYDADGDPLNGDQLLNPQTAGGLTIEGTTFKPDDQEPPMDTTEATAGTWSYMSTTTDIDFLTLKFDGFFALYSITDYALGETLGPISWDITDYIGMNVLAWDESIVGVFGDSAYNKGKTDYAFGHAAGYAVVPVPAAVWLFASGLLGLVGVARKRA